MYCSKCGAQNRDEAGKCVICGTTLVKPPPEEPAAPPPPPPPGAPPTVDPTPARASAADESIPNHLVWAILSTLFCCWPTGIVAIVFAAQVSSKIQAGDTDGARRASANAKLWCWITFGLGLAGIALGVLAAIVGAASGY